jgi:hypothetical protein
VHQKQETNINSGNTVKVDEHDVHKL